MIWRSPNINLPNYEETECDANRAFRRYYRKTFSLKQENVASTTDAFCTVIDPHSLEASFTVIGK